MTWITAHRGGAGLWPENSLTAFRGSVGLHGLNAVELDVQACRDGHLVVFHDDDLDRTTDARGRLLDMDCAAVRRSRLTGTVDEPPPTLDEVLEILLPTTLELKLEIKQADGADAADMVRRCLRATDDFGMTDRTLFMSFDRPVIDQLRKRAGPVRFSMLSDWPRDGASERMDRLIDDAIAWHAAAIGIAHQPPERSQDQVAARADLFRRARAASLRVGVWTVDSVDDLRAWLSNDAVDDVTTDWPDRALAIRNGSDAAPWR